MNTHSKIYVAGHRGLVGSALVRRLKAEGYHNIIIRTHAELDLTQQEAVARFFHDEKPEYVFLAAAKVGGIYANDTYPADFIYQNIMTRALEIMSEADQDEFEKMLDAQSGPEEIFVFLKNKVSNFEEIIKEEAEKFKNKATGIMNQIG